MRTFVAGSNAKPPPLPAYLAPSRVLLWRIIALASAIITAGAFVWVTLVAMGYASPAYTALRDSLIDPVFTSVTVRRG